MSYKTTTISTTGGQAALTKNRNENAVLISVNGSHTGLEFTVEASTDGTNYQQVAVIDCVTGLLVAGGTTIVPGSNVDKSWLFPLAVMFSNVRLNVSQITTGTPTLDYFGQSVTEQLYSSVAGAAGSFTNGTFSGTLAVTGASTFTGETTHNGGIQLNDNDLLTIGTGDDATLGWDGTDLNLLPAAANQVFKFGVDGAGWDVVFYGDTASTNVTFDQSANSLIFNGAAPLVFTGTTGQPEIHLTDNLADALSIEISGSTTLMQFTTTDNAESVSPIGLRTRSTTAVAITGATTLTLADSGGIFTVGQGSAYDIDLPSPTSGPGCRYFFSLTAPAANNVTITVAGSAATFVGSIISEGQIVVATGSTLTFASGTALLGDSIEIQSIATNLYHVRAIASALNGITVA